MGIIIEDLPAAASAQPDYVIPAMRSGETARLTAQQLATFIIALVTDSAPATLDTLNELAAALGDDPNFATTVTNALATKASLTGPETLTNKTLTGPLVNGAPRGEFLRGYISGLTVSNNTSDATNDLDFSAGVAASDGATPTLMTLASAMTKRLDANWAAGSGNGGLDTGAPANGWYYPYLIGKSTDAAAADILLSASPTSPAMPSGWDLKRLILPFWRDAGAIRPFTQRGNYVTWVTPVEALNTTSASTVGALVTVAAPPTSGVQAVVRSLLSNGGTANAWVRDTTQTNDSPSIANCDMAVAASSIRSISMKSLFVNSSSQIRYRSDTASVGAIVIACEAFTFPRGAA